MGQIPKGRLVLPEEEILKLCPHPFDTMGRGSPFGLRGNRRPLMVPYECRHFAQYECGLCCHKPTPGQTLIRVPVKNYLWFGLFPPEHAAKDTNYFYEKGPHKGTTVRTFHSTCFEAWEWKGRALGRWTEEDS